MSTSPPQPISNEQKTNLHEVADLMLKIYTTLSDMRYLDPKAIIPGPHPNIPTNLQNNPNINLDPSIIYLYTILPYINTSSEAGGKTDFFHGGTFVDFRHMEEIERGRDPFYLSPETEDFDAENGEYMRGWMTPLSRLGNHGTVLIYDSKVHRIWAVDQEGWGSTDPGVCEEVGLTGTPHEVFREESEWGEDSSGDFMFGEEDDGVSGISESSSEFWSDGSGFTDSELEHLREDEQDDQVDFNEGFEFLDEQEMREAEEATRSKNANSFEHIRSRPAGDFLRSIIQWYRELKEIPGGEHSGGEWMELETIKPLYLKNGWPDEFNGDAFEIDQARAYCAQRAKYFAEDPLRQVECYEGWLEYDDSEKRRQEVEDAKNDDEQWTARFKLWQAEQRHVWNLRELQIRKDIAALRCPAGICQKEEDLPLWEMEMLRVELKALARRTQPSESTTQLSAPPQTHQQRKLAIYTSAYEASVRDAEESCPGRSFETATGIPSLGGRNIQTRIEESRKALVTAEEGLQGLENWAKKLPQEGSEILHTKRLVDEEIEQNEEAVERVRRDLERMEKWLEEHGEED